LIYVRVYAQAASPAVADHLQLPGLAVAGGARSFDSVQHPRPDRHFRSYALSPGWRITLEIHCADGGVALVRGTVERVPWLAGENAQKVVVVDAVARPLPADVRGAA
jgi:hypothetical protein